MKARHLFGVTFVFFVFSLWLQAQQPEFPRPESYLDRVRREGAVLDLGLKDAIKLALTKNLEIAIEDFNEDLNRERIVGTRGFYDPMLRMNFGWRSSESPSTRSLDAGGGIPIQTFKGLDFGTSLQQNLPGGGLFTLGFRNSRNASNSLFAFMNPSFGSNLDVQLRQPLWRGFIKTQTERQLKLYNLDSKITESQFQQKVSEIIQQVENQYWELVYAIENHEIRRKSMELAIIQHENNKKRVEIGVSAPIEITQSHADVAMREQEMIQSEVQIINMQNALKRLLAADPKDSVWTVTMIPTDRPQMRELQITLDQAIDTSIERRPELAQMRLEAEKKAVDHDYLKKAGKPSLDLIAGLTSTGRAGRIFETSGLFTGTQLDRENPFFGHFSNAWNQVLGFDYLDYSFGVEVLIPLRNRSNEAELAAVAISERQLLSRVKDVQQRIIVDVRNAYETIATQRKRLDAAKLATRLSEERLEGETKRFQAGLSTNFNVLQYQRDLATAQGQELRALVDYQKALTDLLKAMYTIIDESDVTLAKER